MVTKIEGYQSRDGKFFSTEESAIRHECVEQLCRTFPELAIIRPRVEARLEAIADAVGPMVEFRKRVPSARDQFVSYMDAAVVESWVGDKLNLTSVRRKPDRV